MQLAEAQSVIVQQQTENRSLHSLTHQLIQQNVVVLGDRINTLTAATGSVTAYVPQRHGLNILLTAEEVHGWQNKPPEVNACLSNLYLLTDDLRR
jgi:hypothetical protein